MRLLDLFCGAGGASEGYRRAGFEVVGVDIRKQPHYPFEFVKKYVLCLTTHYLKGFDAIHASPPCQKFTAYRRKGLHVGEGYPNLIPEIRRQLTKTGVPWVIENVMGAPLENPIRLCGSSFGLDVRRHRLFESSISLFSPDCQHQWQLPRFKPATNRKNLRKTVEVGVWRIPLPIQKRAMGISWMTLPELSEAIPPAYTEFIGKQILSFLEGVSP